MQCAFTYGAMSDTMEYNAHVLSRIGASWAVAPPVSGRTLQSLLVHLLALLKLLYMGHDSRLSRSTICRKKLLA